MAVQLVNCNPTTRYVSSVYADASFFCDGRDRLSLRFPSARIALANLYIQQVQIFISDLVLDEVWWAYIRRWYRRTTGNELYAYTVKGNPSILEKFYGLLRTTTRKIFNIPRLMMVPYRSVPADTVNLALDLVGSEQLMPRDSYHLAYVLTHDIEGFITADQDFDNLNLRDYNLTIYKY